MSDGLVHRGRATSREDDAIARPARVAAAERRVIEAAKAWERSDNYSAIDELYEAIADLRAAREAK